MVQGLGEWSQCYKTGEGRYNQSFKKILGGMSNWKSPGPDLVQGFWFKNFSSLQGRVRLHFKVSLDSGFAPSFLTKGKDCFIAER